MHDTIVLFKLSTFLSSPRSLYISHFQSYNKSLTKLGQEHTWKILTLNFSCADLAKSLTKLGQEHTWKISTLNFSCADLAVLDLHCQDRRPLFSQYCLSNNYSTRACCI